MPIIACTSKIGTSQKNLTGSKAESLTLLNTLGLQVPSWIVVPSSEFANHVPHDIIGQSAQDVTEFIGNIKIDPALLDQIFTWINKNGLSNDYFGVRSSICLNEASEHTFAGQLKTCLFVPASEINDAILSVWASPFTSSAYAYRAQWGLSQKSIRIAVIIQKMINSDVSGFSMGFDPGSGSRTTIGISAMYGLCQGIGSERLDTDHFTIDLSGSSPSRVSRIFEKKRKVVFNQVTGSGITSTPVIHEMRSKPCLTPEQTLTLAKITRMVSLRCGKPQMLEWAFSQNKLYILQTRSISAIHSIADTTEKKRKWISPDFSFILNKLVSPLAYSIIRKNNVNALYSFCKESKTVPLFNTKIEDCDVLGNINGKLLLNYDMYKKLTSQLPFEKYLSANNENSYKNCQSFFSHVNFIKDCFKLISASKKILENKKENYQCYKNPILTVKFQQLICSLDSIETELELLWKLLIKCDYYLNAINKFLQKMAKKVRIEFSNFVPQVRLMSKKKNLVSEIQSFCEITKVISENSIAKDLFTDCSADVICKKLALNSCMSSETEEVSNLIIRKLILNHIRNFEDYKYLELKFGPVDTEQNLHRAIGIIKSYLLADLTDILKIRIDNNFSNRRIAIESLPFTKSIHCNFLLSILQRLIDVKSDLIFFQYHNFKSIRLLFNTIGNRFYSEGIIDDPNDICFLTRDEIVDFIQGYSVTVDLKALISIRKKESDINKKSANDIALETYGIVYHANVLECNVEDQKQSMSMFCGIGNGAGAVFGKVLFAKQSVTLNKVDNTILVVESSDPGWIPYLPLIKGLIVESGSIFSEIAQSCLSLGLPCVVLINEDIKDLHNGDCVELDGYTGRVNVIEGNSILNK